MKATLKVSKFKEVLDLASKFVSSHSTLPVLENIYIKSDGSRLIFRATDMEKYIQIKLDADVDWQWAITANIKMLRSYIKTLKEDEINLHIDQQNDELEITSQKDDFLIKWIQASEYVEIPDVQEDNAISMDASNLIKWISKVSYAVTERSFTPALTWILVRLKKQDNNNKIVFAGTDTFRLAEYKMDYQGEYRDMSIIIPKSNILDIQKITDYFVKNDGERLQLNFSKKFVSFSYELDDMEIYSTSLLVEWDFPDYEKWGIIPDEINSKVVLEWAEFDRAIEKISILTKDINSFVDIEAKDDKLVITSGETDQWEAETQLPAIIEWEKYSFGINGEYIQDFIKNIDNPQLSMQIKDSTSSILFKDKWDDKYTYIAKPFVK